MSIPIFKKTPHFPHIFQKKQPLNTFATIERKTDPNETIAFCPEITRLFSAWEVMPILSFQVEKYNLTTVGRSPQRSLPHLTKEFALGIKTRANNYCKSLDKAESNHYYSHCHLRSWRNRQTRTFEGRMGNHGGSSPPDRTKKALVIKCLFSFPLCFDDDTNRYCKSQQKQRGCKRSIHLSSGNTF